MTSLSSEMFDFEMRLCYNLDVQVLVAKHSYAASVASDHSSKTRPRRSKRVPVVLIVGNRNRLDKIERLSKSHWLVHLFARKSITFQRCK